MVSPISWFEQKGQFEKMSENEDEFRAVVLKRTVFLIDIEPSHVQGLGHKTIGLFLEKLLFWEKL